MTNHYSLKESINLLGIDRDSPYRNMVLDFIEERARQLAARLPSPETKAGWLQRAAELNAPLLHSLGLTNLSERTPLNAQVMGKLERSDYIIEKLVYEPRPGFAVSAHLYLPRQAHFPAPAILYSPGHWMENCKLEPDVQLCCANLARLGFVTLVYDMIGQGERLGDYAFDHGHLEPLLVGQCQEGLMVWESIRAIDYLVSRPEVDPGRIGMTGSSGGGLNTFYTSAVDERIQVSVPVCYVNTFLLMMAAERDRNWEDGVDLCNQVPGVMAYAEMADICGLIAPKPQCIIAAIHDLLFPIEGVRQVYRDIERIYALLDTQERVRLVEIDAPHGYDQEMRQVAYGWLVRWLKNEGDGSPIPEVTYELIPPPYPADPQNRRRRGAGPMASPGLCFPEGRGPLCGPAVTALTRQLAASLPPARRLPTQVDDWAGQRTELLARIPAVLGPWPDRMGEKRNRLYNRTLFNNLIAERLVFESELAIDIPAIFLAPAQWQTHSPAVVYVDEWGKSAGLANGLIETLLAAQIAVLAIDVRGVGEVAASDFEATSNALMTDRPFFGQQVWDVLRAIDGLWRGNCVTGCIDNTRIGCIGRGLGGLLTLYAAALDERVRATVVWQAPVSYKSLIIERPAFPASAYLFDALNHFDLPDLMATVAPRPLLVANPVDGKRQSLSRQTATEFCGWPSQIYALLETGVGDWQLVIEDSDQGVTPVGFVDWLRDHL
jgi:cephalosporin-C deacetylase-like acetyl esterase